MTEAGHPAQPPLFPFAAIIGQQRLLDALLIAAADPGLGGVLIEGPRGTAKSTAARSLTELLGGAPFVTLPLGASLEHLVGTLDLGRALENHEVRFSPGLLSRANGGVLYVDEVNLLPDVLVDVLLDASASGINVVERDGISTSHASRFVLVGTMNPEEGELRPQLLDRFALRVTLDNITEPALRKLAVRSRLAFDADPDAFRQGCEAQQAGLRDRLQRARAAIAGADRPVLTETVCDLAHDLCIAARVDGLRADLALMRAAQAWAALENSREVTPEHLHHVAEMVLSHRRHPDVPAPASTPAAGTPQAPQSQEERDGGAGGGNSSSDGDGDADWGAMPTEPVGLALVKPLRPLHAGKDAPPKKA